MLAFIFFFALKMGGREFLNQFCYQYRSLNLLTDYMNNHCSDRSDYPVSVLRMYIRWFY